MPGIEKNDAVKAGKFLLGFLVVFAVIYFAAGVIPLIWIEALTANTSAGILNLFGVSGEVVSESEPVLILINDLEIGISYLCTGLLELVVLVSVILASFGVGVRERIFGAIGAVVVGFVFNQLRIVASVLVILGQDIAIAELTHDVLFRVFLFLVVVGFYSLWFYWATKRKY